MVSIQVKGPQDFESETHTIPITASPWEDGRVCIGASRGAALDIV